MSLEPVPDRFDSQAVDQAFARFVARGTPADLAVVFDAVAPGLLRVALHLTGDAHAAEDLVQETFLTAIEARASFRTGHGVQPWLVGILRNRARRSWRRRERVLTTDGAAPCASDPLAATLAAEVGAEVDAAIQELPATYRPVLRLHLRNQLSAADIAVALERPSGSVRTQIVRGLELLRQRLPRGLAVSACTGVRASRGLAALRTTVLAAADRAVPAAPVATAAATLARASIMQKATLLGFAGAIAGFATWALGASVADHAPAVAGPVVRSVGLPSSDRDPRPADERFRQGVERTQLATAKPAERRFGTVLVRARWDEDGALAAGVTVTLNAWGQPNMNLLRRSGTTGPRGTVRIQRVPVGEITVSSDVEDHKIQVGPDQEVFVDVKAKRWARATGTVVDDAGHPVAGATVLRSGYANPEVFEVTIADRAGRFAIDVGEARYLGARAAGQVDSYLEYLTLKKGELIDITLRLRGPAASVAGTVRDGDGHAIPHAWVIVQRSGGGSVELAGGRRATTMPATVAETDADGHYCIDGLEPGARQSLVARALDCGCSQGICELVAGDTRTVDIILPVGCIVQGRVLDAAGAPVANAYVIAERGRSQPYAGFTSCTAQSAADGSFRLDSVPGGQVTVRAGHGERGKAETSLRLQPGTTTVWDARLATGPSIIGRVVDEHGKPRPGFIVELQSYDVNAAHSTNRPADAGGRFAFHALLDEPVRVNVFPTYLDIACWHVDDVRPDRGELVLTVADAALPSARLHGTISDADGKPAPGARLLLWQGRNGMGPGFALDEASLAFTLGPVPAGDYRVVASARDVPDVHLGTMHLTAGADLDLGHVVVGRSGSLHAVLRDADGNDVPDRDHLAVLTPDGEQVAGASVAGSECRIAALAPGRYLAQWRSMLQPFTVTAGATTELALRPAARITQTLTLRETSAIKAQRPRGFVEVDLLDAAGGLLDRVRLYDRNRSGESWQGEVLAVKDPVTVVVRIEGHERARRIVTLGPGVEIELD